MRLTSVDLTPETLPRCAALWGDRSFYAEAEFESALRHAAELLKRRRARGALLLDEYARPRYFGMTVFAHEALLEPMLDGSPARIGCNLLGPTGLNAILDETAIGRGNATGGLNLVVIAQGYAMGGPADPDWGTLIGALVKDFYDLHRGFRLRRIMGEVFSDVGTDIVLRSGAYPDVRCTVSTDRNGSHVSSATFSLTHQQAVAMCSPLLPMFTYFPPRVFFTPPEQDVLREAMNGATDVQIANRLGIGLAAVKSRLTRAYERVQARLPDLLPPREMSDTVRGAQVRHVVLDFVRRNPSELTPYECVRALHHA